MLENSGIFQLANQEAQAAELSLDREESGFILVEKQNRYFQMTHITTGQPYFSHQQYRIMIGVDIYLLCQTHFDIVFTSYIRI